MNRTRTRTLALAVVVVGLAVGLAGCNQVRSAVETPTEERLTPVPLSDETDRPGIDGDGEGVDPVALVRTHEESLAERNYTLAVSQRVVGPDGAALRESERYREVAVGGRSYWGYVRYEFGAPALQEFGTTDYWSNGSHVATRYDSPLRQPQTRLWATETEPVTDYSNRKRLLALVRAADPSVVERAENGTVVLAGTAATPDGRVRTPPSLTDLRNVSARFRVRPDGSIARWTVTYDATFENRTVRVERDGRLTAVGETTVERPAWVANATVVED